MASYILKRREIRLGAHNPYRTGGVQIAYSPWKTVSKHEEFGEAVKAISTIGMYDWGVFHQGQRVNR